MSATVPTTSAATAAGGGGSPVGALLVLDAQPAVIGSLGAAGTATDDLLARWVTAVEAARRRGVLVVFVRVALRPGHPDLSPVNRMHESLAGTDAFDEGVASSALDPRLQVGPDDVVVVKRRVSAFAGSDLDVILRSRAVTHVALCGATTGGVVLSTLREAADRDLVVAVLADGVADPDPEIHHLLLTKLFPSQAEVVSTAAWIDGLSS